MDFYRILNVSRNATLHEIKSAYRVLAFKFHPDRNSTLSKHEAAAKFHAISNAYKTLADVKLRHDYDQQIGNRHSDWQHANFTRASHHAARSKMHKHTAPKSTNKVNAVRPTVSREHFDVKLWNVWHYGDDPDEFTSLQNKTSSHKQQNINNTDAKVNQTESNESDVNWSHYYGRKTSESVSNSTKNSQNHSVKGASTGKSNIPEVQHSAQHTSREINEQQNTSSSRPSEDKTKTKESGCTIS